MADWNPNEPRLLGLEWMPTVESGVALDAASQIGAAAFRSTGAETVATLGAFFRGLTEQGQWLMEVYRESDAVIDPDSEDVFRPNADIARVNATNQAGATTNLYQSIDEAVLDLSDYVTSTAGNGASYDHELNTSGWAAGRRVKDVIVTFTGRQVTGSHTWQLMVNDSTEGFFTYWSQIISTETGLFTASVSLGESNPFTGLPWWQGDITDFDSGAKKLRWFWRNPSDETAEARLYQVFVTVVWADENRECVGAFTPAVDGWATADVVTPAGGATWSKANARDYVVTLRRFRRSGAGTGGGPDVPPPSESGRAQWGFLEGPLYVPSRSSFAPVLDARGGISDLGVEGVRGYAFIMETSAPAVSVDSQPYNALRLSSVTSAIFTGQQEMTPTVNQTPTRLRVLALSTMQNNTGALDFTIAEATTINTWSASITPADVAAAPFADATEQWKIVEVPLTVTAGTGTITAGNQVTVDFQAADPELWDIAFLECVNFFSAPDDVGTIFTTPGTGTYGSTTDQGVGYDVDGTGGPKWDSSESQNADYAMQLVEPPAEPANPAAVADTLAVPGDGSDCTADIVNGAALTWDATALGADFARYEISRNETGTAAIIISQTDETIEAAYDFTALRGVAAQYCIRVVDDLGIGSDWAAMGQVIASAVDCELIFVSNERLDVAVTGIDPPVRTWEFLSPPATVFMQVEGRDYQLEIKPTEWRGDRFTRDVLLWGATNGAPPPGGSGRVVFDRILELAQADVAYIAVLDSDGRRWLAAIQPTNGRRVMPGEQHRVNVTVTEITADPLVEFNGAQIAP